MLLQLLVELKLFSQLLFGRVPEVKIELLALLHQLERRLELLIFDSELAVAPNEIVILVIDTPNPSSWAIGDNQVKFKVWLFVDLIGSIPT
ncbi:uncharacterized protein FSUBG_106 [Fusarium subglutinans]|uniref:Uncharacterized protein n=1 Tax=Gibberella subglutinans TaxID=42677 RepID=A0A8H5QI47_GIBSU|nr:uncharacterized protein FSUBG_106 [Fusarium subglutinans]KAF5614226.1 hypothetical protein FSUBG_106 [Fusarium subglutinans]